MRILITGVTGQDGFYLAQEAYNRNHTVFGLVRGQNNPKLVEVPINTVNLQGDLLDGYSIEQAVEFAKPDAIINLGAITYIPFSWAQPEMTFKVNTLGVLNVLNAAKAHDVKVVVQASTSEMYGNSVVGRADEDTPMNPVSPYGVSKLAAHHLCQNYAVAHNMKVVSAIMFNHESPRRGPDFVTRKITMGVARIKKALEAGEKPGKLFLGNLDAQRDWGYSPDYMKALLQLVEGECSGSFVIATGRAASVREFASVAFASVDLDWAEWVETSPANLRPNELNYLRGNPRKMFLATGWSAHLGWQGIARLMVKHDMGEFDYKMGEL